MEVWKAIILGAVQGFSEFLPVSSSGHLILLQRWLGVEYGGLFFDVMLHIGTLIPVCIVLFKEILALFKTPKKLLYLIIATIPAGLTGIFLGDKVEVYFYSGDLPAAILLGVTFILTATELFVAEIVYKKREVFEPLSMKQAIYMGLGQGLAIVPGLSRSGTVISAGCFSGLEKNQNAAFTFMMSIPVILGAALVSGYKCIKQGVSVEIAPLIAGVLTAAVTGYIAIKFMIAVIKKTDYKWFSLYLVVIAIVSVLSKAIFGV